jgi:hypothetical protein
VHNAFAGTYIQKSRIVNLLFWACPKGRAFATRFLRLGYARAAKELRQAALSLTRGAWRELLGEKKYLESVDEILGIFLY